MKMKTYSLDLTDPELFSYRHFTFDSIRLLKKKLPEGKPDGVKYIVIGEMHGWIEIALVKSYWSGKLIVNSPHHVKWMADRVKEVYGEIL